MSAITTTNLTTHSGVDRIGIMASILCAIHCALTPILLILLPTFGKAWAHPSTHWGMAIIVIPIAIYMMRKGYQTHSKKWVVVAGSIGIFFIIVGAILPYVELDSSSKSNLFSTVVEGSEKIVTQPENGASEQTAGFG